MDIKIQFYEEWMKEQIVALFVQQYGVEHDEFSTFFANFYEHDFQRPKTIRIAAVSGEQVVGFQSFFYWPYRDEKREYNSFQSGNSLVHPDFRGQGMFQRMLNFVYENEKQLGLDFFVGFPVEASIRSFRKNGWNNLLNLKWFVKPVNVAAPGLILLQNADSRLKKVFDTEERFSGTDNQDGIRVKGSQQFIAWRRGYETQKKLFHLFEEGADQVQFEMKFSTRKKVLGELVIGDIKTTTQDPSILAKAFKSVCKKARKSRVVSFVSCAINAHADNPVNKTVQAQFRPMDKEIYFITRNFCEEPHLDDPANWTLYRSDIDTW